MFYILKKGIIDYYSIFFLITFPFLSTLKFNLKNILTVINWYTDEHACPIPVQKGVFVSDKSILRNSENILFSVILNADHSSCK